MCFLIDKMFDSLVWVFTRTYRWFLSPFLHTLSGPGMGCRFEPTCSHYAEEAIREHGVLRGGVLSVARICKCNPWGPSGFDPVPQRTISQLESR